MPAPYSLERRNLYIAAYDRGMTVRQIVREIGGNSVSICRLLREQGRVLHTGRVRCRTYTINDQAFSDVSDPATAYWTGFVLADGCVTPTWYLIVGLAKKDLLQLEKLRDYLGSNAPIRERFYEKGEGWNLIVCSKVIVSRLNKLGIVPAKSHIAYAPEGFKESRDFWRGVVDGDGHISANGKFLEVCGSFSVCQSFSEYIFAELGLPSKVEKHSTIWRVRYSTRPTYVILEHLYRDASVSLDRKQILAEATFDRVLYRHLKKEGLRTRG